MGWLDVRRAQRICHKRTLSPALGITAARRGEFPYDVPVKPLLFLTLAAAIGCSTATPRASGIYDTHEPNGSGGSGGDGGAGGGEPPTASLDGVVRDQFDAVVPGAALQLCAEICYSGATDAAGTFAYEDVRAGHYKLQVRGDPNSTRVFGGVEFPLDLEPDATVSLPGALTLVEIGAGQPIVPGEQTVTFDKLSLTFDRADLTFPYGAEEGVAAGIRVEPQHWPPNSELDESIVALWVLAPYATVAASPVSISIADEFGLTEASFLVLDETTGMFEATSTGEVSDGAITSPAGEGLSRFTWIALKK